MAKKKNIPLESIIELHNQGLYDKEIAQILGCTRENIVKRLNKAGFKNRQGKIDDIALRNRISNSLKGRFVGENNPNYKGFSDEDKIRLYSVFGGIPYYNRLIDSSKSVKQNIIDLIASPDSRFENEVQMYLKSEISKMVKEVIL